MKKTTNVFKICTKKWLNKLLLDFAKYLCSGSNHVSFRFQLQEDTTLADSGFFKTFLYQGGMKATVSWVFEDLKFKISEGYDQNWCFPDSAQLAVSV